jgi:hypothetical protein
VDWINVAQDRDWLQALMNTLINLSFYHWRITGGLPPKLLVTCLSRRFGPCTLTFQGTNSTLPALLDFHDFFISFTHRPRPFPLLLAPSFSARPLPRISHRRFLSTTDFLGCKRNFQASTELPILLLPSALSEGLNNGHSSVCSVSASSSLRPVYTRPNLPRAVLSACHSFLLLSSLNFVRSWKWMQYDPPKRLHGFTT